MFINFRTLFGFYSIVIEKNERLLSFEWFYFNFFSCVKSYGFSVPVSLRRFHVLRCSPHGPHGSGGRLLSLGVWWGARGGELCWTGEDRGGPGAGPGSLAELAGNDGELAGVCRVCPSHENLHQLPPPHLTAPRTCAAWYQVSQFWIIFFCI